ncbi:hypothetical protein [Methylosinus sp. Sm6]|uniref:hypothetical protein n=1 Tax=Methylosinus sp. Sm6 TaxID=2866948 RepID=UPI001C99CCA1|nr:hypothetical protein [Methylosinus sp. Sm6]MBY6240330.1 hypothetical protein [Methylosinus sp. Sm6]
MRSSVKFTIAVFSTLLAGGALAAPRDPLVVPGIGPESSPAAAYRPRHSSPAVAYSAPRRHVRYRVAEQRPRVVRVASFAPRPFVGETWDAPRPYDDEYRPAAYNAADAYPPPARPWLGAAPVCGRLVHW